MHTKKLLPGLVLALALTGASTLAPADAASDHHTRPAKAGSFQVTASVRSDEVVKGEQVKIKGSVTPAAPGARVSLLVRYADQKQWKTIGHATIRSNGTFSVKDEAGSVRARKYRVVKPAGQGRGAGRSHPMKVTVFGWRTLDSLQPLGGNTIAEGGSATINGQTYASSLKGPLNAGRIEYNLNRDCLQLDAVYGIDDSSQLGASAVLSVFGDGVQKHSAAYGLTQAQQLTVDLSDVFRLAVTSTQTGGAVPAVGTPKVLCSF